MANASDLSLRGAKRRGNLGKALAARTGPAIKRENRLRLWRRSLRSRWRLCRLTDAASPLRGVSAFGSHRLLSGIAEHARVSNCHCEAPKGPWRPEREARGSALGVQSRSTRPDNRALPAKTQLPARDSHVASLLGMTRQGSAAVHQCPCAVEWSFTRRSLPVKGTPHP